MSQLIDEILNDLRSFVAGRGREDNFLYSKDDSRIRCVDFSSWLGLRLIKNDIFALAVFKAQLDRDTSSTEYYTVSVGVEEDDVEEESYEPVVQVSLEREVKHQEQEINHLLSFPFEEYFSNDIRSAKIDLLVAWLLGYYGESFAKAMMPYRLNIKNAKTYIDSYNQSRNKQFQLPPNLPDAPAFDEFQHELRKLPLATRLHLFDVSEWRNSKQRSLSDMTFSNTREEGIDLEKSAKILQHSKLITSSPDGTGFVSPKYAGAVSVALDYTKKIAPVYKDWWLNVTNAIEKKGGVYVYDDTDPNDDGFFV